MTILTVSCMVYFCLCYFYLFILSYLQFNIATNGLDSYDEYQDKHYTPTDGDFIPPSRGKLLLCVGGMNEAIDFKVDLGK